MALGLQAMTMLFKVKEEEMDASLARTPAYSDVIPMFCVLQHDAAPTQTSCMDLISPQHGLL